MENIYRNILISDVYMVHLTLFCLLFIKTEKLQEHDLYLNQIIHNFDLTFFS